MSRPLRTIIESEDDVLPVPHGIQEEKDFQVAEMAEKTAIVAIEMCAVKPPDGLV